MNLFEVKIKKPFKLLTNQDKIKGKEQDLYVKMEEKQDFKKEEFEQEQENDLRARDNEN